MCVLTRSACIDYICASLSVVPWPCGAGGVPNYVQAICNRDLLHVDGPLSEAVGFDFSLIVAFLLLHLWAEGLGVALWHSTLLLLRFQIMYIIGHKLCDRLCATCTRFCIRVHRSWLFSRESKCSTLRPSELYLLVVLWRRIGEYCSVFGINGYFEDVFYI